MTQSSQINAAPRFVWVDNLRTFIIVLVVNMHACVTYSHVGGWYINEPPEPSFSAKLPFILWQGHLQAFFMGLLFFISGVFAIQSFDRRGPRPFLRERLIRLGLPALLYMLTIHPFLVYGVLGHPHVPDRPDFLHLYFHHIASGKVFGGNGPLWFALSLLFFCLILAITPRRPDSASPRTPVAPSVSAILVFGVILIVTTFAVRVVQPIGSNILNFQLCFFPQYVAAFAVGTWAGRNGWLETLAARRSSRIAGCVGILGGPALLAGVIWLGGPPPETGPNPYAGGWNLRAAGLAAWEQLAGLAISLGLIALFHRHLNRANTLTRWFAEHSFAVYVLHAPVLVALTLLLRPLQTALYLKVLLLTFTGLLASYAVAAGARRIPGLRKIL